MSRLNYVKTGGSENIYNFTLKNCVYLNLCNYKKENKVKLNFEPQKEHILLSSYLNYSNSLHAGRLYYI